MKGTRIKSKGYTHRHNGNLSYSSSENNYLIDTYITYRILRWEIKTSESITTINFLISKHVFRKLSFRL